MTGRRIAAGFGVAAGFGAGFGEAQTPQSRSDVFAGQTVNTLSAMSVCGVCGFNHETHTCARTRKTQHTVRHLARAYVGTGESNPQTPHLETRPRLTCGFARDGPRGLASRKPRSKPRTPSSNPAAPGRTPVDRLTRCRYLRRNDQQCTGEAIDPDAPILLCLKHAGRVMALVMGRTATGYAPTETEPSR